MEEIKYGVSFLGIFAVFAAVVFGVKTFYRRTVPAKVQAALAFGGAVDKSIEAFVIGALKWAAIIIGALVACAIASSLAPLTAAVLGLMIFFWLRDKGKVDEQTLRNGIEYDRELANQRRHEEIQEAIYDLSENAKQAGKI